MKTKLVHNFGVRSIQIFNHLLSLYGIYYLTQTGEYHWLLYSFISWFITGQFGINVAFHRLLSHRSYKTHIFFERFFSFIGCLCTLGSPLAWVAIHRQHHKYTETKKDVHSPYILGNWRAWFGFWNYPIISPSIISDLRKDKFQKFLHKYYIQILAVFCLILFLINPLAVIFIYAIPSCMVLHCASSIIVIAHRHGYKSYPINDESRNSWIASLFTLGEGWHNTHHAKPYQWKHGEKWWEFDVPAIIIKAIKQ